MDKTEFQELTAYVEKELNIPGGVVFAEGYEDWQTRLRLARILTRNFQKYDKAIELFEGAVGSKPLNVEQFEDIVWALRDLFVCIYYHEKDFAKALKYIDQAITMMELDPDKKFTFFIRGELWCWRWNALKELGNLELALQEAQLKMQYAYRTGSNSYRYYAYYFIASLAYFDGEYEVATETLQQALQYYPVGENAAQLNTILSDTASDNKAKYEQLLQIVRQEAVWDI